MAAFQDALRQRLATIQNIGEDQTTWERLKNQREAAAAQYGRNLAWQSAENNRMGMAQRNASGIVPGAAGGSFEKFLRSISAQESGGNYGARNRSSGAMGKYQIMPGNLGGRRSGWDYEALGYDVNAAQFMRSPQIQEQIAQYKLKQYYNRYGAAGAAIAWYAGPGAANRYAKTGYVSNRPYGNYPSILAYVQSVLGR